MLRVRRVRGIKLKRLLRLLWISSPNPISHADTTGSFVSFQLRQKPKAINTIFDVRKHNYIYWIRHSRVLCSTRFGPY